MKQQRYTAAGNRILVQSSTQAVHQVTWAMVGSAIVQARQPSWSLLCGYALDWYDKDAEKRVTTDPTRVTCRACLARMLKN